MDRSIAVEGSVSDSVVVTGNANRVIIYQSVNAVQAQLSPAPRILGANPYRGLAPFLESDADGFWGREKLTESLWESLRALCDANSEKPPLRILPILGPSGSGKSSIARAGLLPELARHPWADVRELRVVVMTPGSRPIQSLASVLARIVTGDSVPVAKGREFSEEMRRAAPHGAFNGLQRIADAFPNIDQSPLIVVVDQFEEVYSLCSDVVERDAFIANLLDAAGDRSRRVSFILTLRTDFIGRTQEHPQLNGAMANNGRIIPAMSADELRDAIAKPAAAAGRPFDQSTIDLLISQTEGREGALPLLQFALTVVWEAMANNQTAADALQKAGGVGGALAQGAQAIYDSLNDADKRIARRAFVSFIQLGDGAPDTRRRVVMSELVADGENLEQVDHVLNCFARPGARIVTLGSTTTANKEKTAELAHESLFKHWQPMRDWVDSRRDDIRLGRRLAEASSHWEQNGRADGLLWRSPDLEIILARLPKVQNDFTAIQTAFVTASKHFAQEENRTQLRRQRYVRMAAAAFASLAIVATIVAVWARKQHRLASDETKVAQTQRQIATDGEAELHRRLVQANASRGQNLVAAGDYAGALPWFAEAIRLEADSPPRQRIQRLRYAMAANRYPNLQKVFSHEKLDRIQLSHDRRHVLSSSTTLKGTTASVWDISSGKRVNLLLDRRAKVNGLDLSPNGKLVATASGDGAVQLWDAENGQLAGEPIRHNGLSGARSVVFSRDGRQLFTGSDETVMVWDVQTRGLIGKPIELTAYAGSLMLSNAGDRLLVGHGSFGAEIWSVNSRTRLGTLEFGKGEMPVFSPDGERIGVVNNEVSTLACFTYAAENLTKDGPAMKHSSAVYGCEFSPDGRWLLSSSGDGRAQVWDWETGLPVCRPMEHRAAVSRARFNRQGTQIVTASNDRTARVWMAATGEPVTAPLRHESDVIDAQFIDENRMITATAGGVIRIWNIGLSDVGKPVKSHQHFNAGNPLQFQENALAGLYSPDEKLVATTGWDFLAHVWNATTRAEIGVPREHDAEIHWINFSPDGTRLVTASEDATARVWDVQTGKPLTAPLRHGDAVWSAAFSPNGKMVVTASEDQTARVWDAETGRPLGTPMHHADLVRFAFFSPDSARVATASRDRTARVWDARTGKPLTPTLSSEGEVGTLTFSEDGNLLATGGDGTSVQLWEIATAIPVGPPIVIIPPSAFPNHLAVISFDGYKSLTAGLWTSGANVPYRWDFPSDERPLDLMTTQAQLLACYRIDVTGGTSLLESQDVLDAANRLDNVAGLRR